MIPVQKAKHTWLSGKIKCGVCGYAVTAKEFDGGRRRYLRCSNRLNSKTCKGTGTLYTNEVESVVYNEMKEKLAQFRHLSPSENEVPNIEQTQLENELAVIDKEISELLKKVKDSDNALFRYINERINALDVRKDEINERIKELSRKNEIPVDEIDNHLTMWEELSFDDKRRVVDTLIKVIYATSEKITIKWRF